MSEEKSTYFLSRTERSVQKEKLIVLGKASPSSDVLNSNDARICINQYLNSSITPTGVRKPIPLLASKDVPVDGFYFRFENGLREFLQRETFVGFYLGIGENQASNSHTLLLYGVTAEIGDDLTLHAPIDPSVKEIFDFCDPCPPKCPS